MAEPTEHERAERIRRSRQIIAGPDLAPPDDPLEPPGVTTSLEFWYFVALSVLVVLAAVLWAVWGMGAASPALLLLALVLLAAWFVF